MRPPDRGKYARPERERRFVLDAVPAGATGERRIADRYIEGTRLRLRMVGEGADASPKLGQKVRAVESDPGFVLHTTMYLSTAEYDTLAALPADPLTKRRSWLGLAAGPRMAIDVFEGELRGLILAEVELWDEAAATAFEPPAWVAAEVTRDERFTGGRLARTDRAGLHAALADVLGAEAADRLLG